MSRKIICQQEFVSLGYFHEMYSATEETIEEYCQRKFHNVAMLFSRFSWRYVINIARRQLQANHVELSSICLEFIFIYVIYTFYN